MCGQLIFDKNINTIQWRKKAFSTSGSSKLDIHIQKNEVGPLPCIIYKISTKCIKELNIITKTMNLLEENTAENLHDIGFVMD